MTVEVGKGDTKKVILLLLTSMWKEHTKIQVFLTLNLRKY